MPSDRSRPPDPASDAYTGVAYQQGRVTLDRDYNALREIIDRRDETTTRDLVGPCGTPDNGFAISNPLRIRPLLAVAPNLVGQMAAPLPGTIRLPVLSSPPADSYNLLIRSGTMYLGGVRVEWPGDPGGVAVEYSYYSQPDWLSPDPPAAPQTEIVYLQVDEHEVSATEDPNLYDVALGGPDTTQRLRLQRTVRRQGVSASSCAPAWQAQLTAWQALGWGFDANTMRRTPQVRLQAAFTAPTGSTDPCDPVATGGYLGAENQLIRVKWAPTTAGATSGTLIWGFDDASFIYRATPGPTGMTLTLTRSPPDAYHFPGTSQYVEVLRTTSLVGSSSSELAEDGSTVVPRCVAEETGFVTTLAVAYDPATSNQTLTLSQQLPSAYATSPEPLFVRIWQGGAAMGPTGGTLELVDPVKRASTGVTVTLTVPGGTAIAPGSFWMMALRPGTPLTVQPASLLAAPQPPDGPRSWACLLAVVEWPSGEEPVIHDCRIQFDDLIALTQRPAGCCTVSMGPGDVTIDKTLQTAVNSFTGPGTLCLAPGVYPLLAPLQIGPAQAGLTIVAEDGATISAASGSESAFGAGLIVVTGAGNVTLRGLTLIPPAVTVAPSLFTGQGQSLGNLTRIALQSTPQQTGLTELLQIVGTQANNLRTMIGVRVAGSPSLTVEGCTVRFTPPAVSASSPPAVSALFGIGLFAGGACAQLAVRGCVFDASALPATQTAGVQQANGLLSSSALVASINPGSLQGAIGCLISPYVADFLGTPRPLVNPVPPVFHPVPISTLGSITLGNVTPVSTPGTLGLASATLNQPIAAAAIPAATLATPAVAVTPPAATKVEVATGLLSPAIAANLAVPATANLATSATAAATNLATATLTQPASSNLLNVSAGTNLATQTTIATSNLNLKSTTIPQPLTSNLLNLSVGAQSITTDLTILQVDTPDMFTTVADVSGAVLESNIFDSVILAISATAMLDRVRVQDNTVVSSSGGIWLRPLDEPRFTFTTAINPTVGSVVLQEPAVAGDSMWLKLMLMQQETFLTWLLSLLLPLPTGAAVPVFASPEGGTTVRVTGNTIAALGPAATAVALGTPALAAVSGTYTSAIDVGPSLIVADNRLQGSTPLSYPAAVLAVSGRMAVTGNLISNEQTGSPPFSVSLEIFPDDMGGNLRVTTVNAPRIVVTGNVLEGNSNLAQLIRTDAITGLAAPFNTWLPFNASTSN
jgi:hypothetical protein